MLAVQSVDLPARDDVAKAVAHMNERPTLFLKLPPKDTGKPYGMQKLPVKRGEDRFFEALQDNLRRWHGMELGETRE